MMMSVFVYVLCVSFFEWEGWFLVVGDIVNYNVFYFLGMKSYVGIVIWEYDLVYKDWNEVIWMFEVMVENFFYFLFFCVIVGDFVYFFFRCYIIL